MTPSRLKTARSNRISGLWLKKVQEIFSEPQGVLDLGVYMRPGRTHPVVILARGWVYYGLNVEPVPTHFEQYFPVAEARTRDGARNSDGQQDPVAAQGLYFRNSAFLYLLSFI